VALAKVMGESLERYCVSLYDPESIHLATTSQLGEKATDPRRFQLFHSNQLQDPSFPFARPTADDALSWVDGFSLTRNEATQVPATMVHLSYQPATPYDSFEQCPVSGYACGNTLEDAILSGLYEVVERDAFMIFWYHWLRVPGIDLTSSASVETTETLARYINSPVRLFCSDITTDVGVTVALAALTSWRQGWPATTVALGANLDREQAVSHAFQELAANLLVVSSHLQYVGQSFPLSAQQVLRMEDHGTFYAPPQMLPALDPVLRPQRWVTLTGTSISNGETDLKSHIDLKSQIEQCVRSLAAVDLEVIVVDVTASQVEQLGFKVVKVLIPGMSPIDFGMRWRHLGGARLYDAPVRMGYSGTVRDPGGLNMMPHPFP
jgi:ribosomal protein S12 methylthiotransferase accessory factor